MIGGERNGFGNDYQTDILVHSTESNGSSSFTDSSHYGATVGVLNTVTHSNNQYHFGPTSISFGGGPLITQSGIYAGMAKNPNYDDFCIDFWINISDNSERNYTDKLIIGFFKMTDDRPPVPDYNNYCGVRIDYAYGGIYFEYISGGTSYFSIGDSRAFEYSIDTWYHITATKMDDTIKLYIDGVQKFSETIFNANYKNVKNLDYHYAGMHRSAQTTLRSFYIDEWRHSIGNQRWVKNFTPPNRFY